MFRTAIVRSTRQAVARRTFTSSASLMSEGDTGSGFSRAAGEKAGDVFTRREKASEEMWIRNEEKNKLLQLKEKLEKQRQHIDELAKHVDDLVKESGGEQN